MRYAWLLLCVAAAGCVSTRAVEGRTPASALLRGGDSECGRDTLRVRFFDVGQGLAALVELPNGALILVDAGESPTRPGCASACGQWHERFMTGLRAAVGGRVIDALWLTHPHSDHIGGAVDVLNEFRVRVLVHNGVGASSATFARVMETAGARGVSVRVARSDVLDDVLGEDSLVRVTGIIPRSLSCGADVNNCSVGLRVAFCEASVLFVGDAEEAEEGVLEGVEEADVLQVGHHGSNTSSSVAFLKRVKPSWAVISAGRPEEGTNRTCHPRADTLSRLAGVLPAVPPVALRAFGGERCVGGESGWVDVDANSHILSTTRDGTVVMESTGMGFQVHAPEARR